MGVGQIFYKGANGQDYLTKADAELYGGGFISATQEVAPVTMAEADLPAEADDAGLDVQAATPINQLREIAQNRNIKGWAKLTKKALLDAINGKKVEAPKAPVDTAPVKKS